MTEWSEQHLIKNSLSCLLKTMENQVISVELQDNSVVTGVLINVSGAMCLELTNVELKTKSSENIEKSEHIYLAGSRIRYVHLPEDLDITASINSFFEKTENARKLSERRKRNIDKYTYLREVNPLSVDKLPDKTAKTDQLPKKSFEPELPPDITTEYLSNDVLNSFLRPTPRTKK